MASSQAGTQTEFQNFEEKSKYWSLMREVITHEDSLVNHRLSWLFTVQGFLFGGFFYMQGSLLANKLTPPVIIGAEALFITVFLGAAWACIITGSTISA